LEGRRYACYPGFEKEIPDGIRTGKKVEHDDTFVTAEGMGVSFDFGFRLVELLFGYETATVMREQTRYE
jgi:4-methyl-5(b-hydroxyethyl)-thiazole monophosphate biosynthesis